MGNKKITLIETVIVIVVLFLLGMLLLPLALDFVRKNQMQTDMNTAKQLSDAMLKVLSENKTSENAVEHATPHLVSKMDGSDFRKEVYKLLEVEEIKGKTKKNIDGEFLAVPEFYYTLNLSHKQIEIYYGGITEEYKIYPVVGSKLLQ